MNIVFSSLSNVPVFNGIAAVLTANGDNVTNWNGNNKPVFDMLEDLKPEYLFVGQGQIDTALIEGLLEYPQTKLIVYGTAIPKELEDSTALIVVPQHVPDTIMRNLPGATTKIKRAANIVQFAGGYYVDAMKSDLLYITNSASVQRGYINNHLSGVLFNTDYKVKVVGSFKMPCPQYVGRVTIKDTLNFIQSASITLDYDWDIALDVVANQSLPITNVKNDLVPYFTSELELLELVEKFSKNEKLRRKTARQAYKLIIDNDTYFHRTAELGELLGVESWKTQSMDTLKRYRK
jgi:hypothetical protein